MIPLNMLPSLPRLKHSIPIKSDEQFKVIEEQVKFLSRQPLPWIYQAKQAAYERMIAEWRTLKADITA